MIRLIGNKAGKSTFDSEDDIIRAVKARLCRPGLEFVFISRHKDGRGLSYVINSKDLHSLINDGLNLINGKGKKE